jgi:hypothetical protein
LFKSMFEFYRWDPAGVQGTAKSGSLYGLCKGTSFPEGART